MLFTTFLFKALSIKAARALHNSMVARLLRCVPVAPTSAIVPLPSLCFRPSASLECAVWFAACPFVVKLASSAMRDAITTPQFAAQVSAPLQVPAPLRAWCATVLCASKAWDACCLTHTLQAGHPWPTSTPRLWGASSTG